MRFIDKLKKPVIIAGLGANSFNGFDPAFHKKLDPELIYFLKYLSDHCLELGIRGEFTHEILHNIGIENARVIGCPSYFECGPNRILKTRKLNNVNQIVQTSRLPHLNLGLHTVMQDNCDEAIIRKKLFNEGINKEKLTADKEEYDLSKYHIFSGINDWKRFLHGFRFAIGYRLHGAIISMNSGMPALCMNGDSRAKEMCDFLGIPHNPTLDPKCEEELLELFQGIDINDINRRYRFLYLNFKGFLHNNKLKLFEEKTLFERLSLKRIQELNQPSI